MNLKGDCELTERETQRTQIKLLEPLPLRGRSEKSVIKGIIGEVERRWKSLSFRKQRDFPVERSHKDEE